MAGRREDSGSTGDGIELKPQKAAGDKVAHTVSGVSSPATAEKPPAPPNRDYEEERRDTEQSGVAYATVEKKKAPAEQLPIRTEFVQRPERARIRMACLRPLLIVFNLFIWLLGAVITALGIWTCVDKDFWEIQTNLNMTQFASASYVLIVVGVVIMIVGFLGCYGAAASKIWMLVVFSIIVAVLIVLEIAAIALVWAKVGSKNSQEDVKEIARKAMDQMLEDDNKRYFIDLLQAKLKCCGVNGPQDYSMHPSHPKPIPHSCNNEDSLPYEQGCYDAALNYLESKASVLGGIAVAVFLLQVIALAVTIALACGIKNAVVSGIL